MLVKTFEGVTMADAMKAVKSEFGSSAVILSTQKKIIDSHGTQIMEIKAAAPESKKVGAENYGANYDFETIEAQLTVIDQKLAGVSKSVAKENHVHTLETGLQEIKLLLLESLRNKDGNITRNVRADLLDLVQHLKVMGIDETHCTELLNYIQALDIDSQESDPQALKELGKAKAIQWMHGKIKIAPKWSISPGSTSVHAIVGPSGAGKTSLVAKLAAQFNGEQAKKVLVVSYDNRRIAACEQLRIYCKILGITFATMDTPSELESLLLDKRDYDLVIIDTAGRNPRSNEDMNDLKAFSECSIPVDIHLILSLTEKQSQMDRAIRAFSSIGISSLFFSKLDESWTYGEIYNMAQKWSLPLGYFSTGQKIPGSIERASRERVLERIFCL